MPKVNFHAHSSHSDGELNPETLAGYLAAQGVVYAALTDHDTDAGSLAFRESMSLRGLSSIDGMELSTHCSFGDVHILAFWSNMHHAPLAGYSAVEKAERSRVKTGIPDTLETIRSIRASGGSPFVAHPFTVSHDIAVLENLLDELIPAGLDGIEAHYAQYCKEDREILALLAKRRGLVSCAGTDLHEPGQPGQDAGIQVSDDDWQSFRDILNRRAESAKPERRSNPNRGSAAVQKHSTRRFAARIILPALVVMILFITALFGLIIPQFRNLLLDKKKDMIKEITESAASLLGEYAKEVERGKLTLAQAQSEAVIRIRDIRFGSEGKDYLWITDTSPRMIMHPYRPELDGKELAEYKDETGLRVFVEFVKAVSDKNEGYVEYLWQWKDDASRIVPKLSFVYKFSPWNWIIGTGVYLEDVNAEIADITQKFVLIFLATSLILAGLLSFIIQQTLASEQARQSAESAVRESRERYRALAEASHEGTVIVVGGICSFANSSFIEMSGYSAAELPLLGATEIIKVYSDGLSGAAGFIESLNSANQDKEEGAAIPEPFDCYILRKSGEPLDVSITVTRFKLGTKGGFVLAARETGVRLQSRVLNKGDPVQSKATESNRTGFFRAYANRRGGFLEADALARSIFGLDATLESTGFFSVFPERSESDALYKKLFFEGSIPGMKLTLAPPGLGRRDVSISAIIARDSDGKPLRIDGTVEDITDKVKLEKAREQMLALGSTESLYLAAPVCATASPAVLCQSSEPIFAVAEKMRRNKAGEALVADSLGTVIGIVTNGDIADRVVAPRVEASNPIHTIMSAPLHALPVEASLGEALELMAALGVGRIALRKPDGSIAALVRREDLLRLQNETFFTFRNAVLKADSPEELADCRMRLLEGTRVLVLTGTHSRLLIRRFSDAHDLLIEKLLEFAMRELGPSPCPFAFMSSGSLGRREQLPLSDQDNAIAYRQLAGDGQMEQAYFLKLGAFVCRNLEKMGVPFCKGGIMAMSEKWCVPLSTWEGYFLQWISEPEPQRLLEIHMFFDLRACAGDHGLVEELRASVQAMVKNEPAFLIHLATSARALRIPSAPIEGAAEAKEGAALFPTLVRTYALKHAIAATGTFERLDLLAAAGILAPDPANEYADSYEALLALRLLIWVESLNTGGTNAGARGRHSERSMDLLVKSALGKSAALQRRIGYDFLGASL